jgi:hypothetical protein
LESVRFWLFGFLVTLLVWIGYLSQSGADVRSLILWSVIAKVFAVVYAAMALAIFINRTAQGILRVIAHLAKG